MTEHTWRKIPIEKLSNQWLDKAITLEEKNFHWACSPAERERVGKLLDMLQTEKDQRISRTA